MSFKIKVLFGLPMPGGSGGPEASIRDSPVVWGHPSGAGERCGEERAEEQGCCGVPITPIPQPCTIGVGEESEREGWRWAWGRGQVKWFVSHP